MLSTEQSETLRSAATIVRMESRRYYDTYKANSDAESEKARKLATASIEKVSELNKIANELDIIAEGNV
jgi:hypothetical protein